MSRMSGKCMGDVVSFEMSGVEPKVGACQCEMCCSGGMSLLSNTVSRSGQNGRANSGSCFERTRT